MNANDFIKKGEQGRRLAIKQAKDSVPVLENLRSFFYHTQQEKCMNDADNMIQHLNDLKVDPLEDEVKCLMCDDTGFRLDKVAKTTCLCQEGVEGA